MIDASGDAIDLFLCHNGADKDWVRELAEQVESETFDGLPNGRPLRVFFDEWDIDIGQNVLLKINNGLKQSRYVAVVVSPEFLDAPWPTLEWTHVVADDPTNRKGRLIPLFVRDYSAALQTRAELPAPLKTLNWIDFRRPAEFKRSYIRLIRKVRDQLPVRGKRRRPLASTSTVMSIPSIGQDTSAAPDIVSDVVLGNLLPVETYPSTIWSAPTEARRYDDLRGKVQNPPAYVLQDKRLYTFVDLTLPDHPFRTVTSQYDIQSHAVARWKGDPVRWRWFIDLLNRCIRISFFGLPVTRDKRGRFSFLPKDNGDREWRNGSDPARMVAAKKTSVDGTKSFWVHHGAELSFQALGDQLFLCIDPCYVFTRDGRELLTGKTVGPLSVQWGGRERNASILRHIMFWSRTLSRQQTKIEMQSGAQPITISGIPALARTQFGIDFDQIGFTSLLAQVEDELSIAADAAMSGGLLHDDLEDA